MNEHWIMPTVPKSVMQWTSPWRWHVIRPAHFDLGDHTDIGANTVLLCQQGIEVQPDAQIGPNCSILSVDTVSGKQGKVTIEKNARIGANCVVMPGGTVGHDSILGAGSVLTTNMPPGEVWYGTPAVFRRKV